MRQLDLKKQVTDPVTINLEPGKINERKAISPLVPTLARPTIIKNETPGSIPLNDTPVKGVATPNLDIDEDSGLGDKFAGAGLSALAQAPNIITNLSTDPTSSKEATGKVLSMAASGAKIGSAFGPWGTAIGAAGGAIAGGIDNIGYKKRFRAQEDEAEEIKIAEAYNERKRLYFESNTSEQMKSEMDLLRQSQGYTT